METIDFDFDIANALKTDDLDRLADLIEQRDAQLEIEHIVEAMQ